MQFRFSLKDKEASMEADVERLIEKQLDNKSKSPERKTRYQIRQEEKRKNEEMKQKHFFQGVFVLLGIVALFAVFGIVASVFGW